MVKAGSVTWPVGRGYFGRARPRPDISLERIAKFILGILKVSLSKPGNLIGLGGNFKDNHFRCATATRSLYMQKRASPQ